MPKIRKIILILPRSPLYRYKIGAFGFFIRYAPLTLPTLAALVPKDMNIEIEIYDEGVEIIKKEEFSADLIGITAITGTVKRAYQYADYFRSRNIPVVMGGVHASLMPEEAMQHADSVVTGIATETWPRLLRDFEAGNMKRIYVQPDEVDFSGWPLPARNLYDDKKIYFITTNSVQATLGCPNKCEFCVTPYSCKGYHHRPVEDVINEISHINSKHILFVDPSPIENKVYIKKLYKAMIPLKKKWVSPSTIRMTDDEELLDLAAKSGCKGLLLGFESVTDSTLLSISKDFNSINRFYTASKKLHDKGIAIMGCFVFGLDSDDKSVFDRTLEFINKANIDLPRFTVNTPFPGTPFHRKMKDEGRIITDNWLFYDCQHVVIKPKQMTPEELQEGHHRAWREAYDFTSMFKRIAGARSFLEVIPFSNLAYRRYGRHMPRFTKEYMIGHNTLN